MKRWLYIVVWGLQLALATAFWEYIQLHLLSLIPLALMAIMLFQAAMFKHTPDTHGMSTAYGSGLCAAEERSMGEVFSLVLSLIAPFCLPFSLFFAPWVKVLSLLLYGGALLGGALLFRLRHGSEVKRRLAREKEELRRQKAREEQGKY